jgi:zinc transport system substrate-binding protein
MIKDLPTVITYLRKTHTMFLFLLLAIVASACGSSTGNVVDETSQGGRFMVVTTIYPLMYFTNRITASDASIDVRSLIGSGVEAHTFEPTPADIQLLASADLIVANGLDLEPWLDRALDALSGGHAPVIEAANAEDARQRANDDHEGHAPVTEAANAEDAHQRANDDHQWDPHLWLDPILAASQVKILRDALVSGNPDATDTYMANAAVLLDDLVSLDSKYALRLADCPLRHFVTTHAAYGYLADRYGLEQLSIGGLSPESEPSPRKLADLVEKVRSLALTHVLIEPPLSSRVAKTLAAETNLDLLAIHQLESVTREELADHGDYLGLMYDNLDSLTIALGCAA